MANNITIAKGGISVIVHPAEVNDTFSNKLFIITPAQTKDNQADGPKTDKIVDILRVTHQMIIRGYITGTASKTAKAVKLDLINIWKGGGAAGGTVALTYDGNASSFGDTSATNTNPIAGFIEKINFKDEAMDEPDDFTSAPEDYQEVSKYEVAITYIEGIST